MFQTEQKGAVASSVTVAYCDGSSHIAEKEASSFGMLASKQLFTELVQSGLDTTVLNYPPHVSTVIIKVGDNEQREDFICRCKKEVMNRDSA